MTQHSIPAPEFSRPVAVDSLPMAEAIHELTARPEEREALAQRFDLISLDELSAVVRLKRIAGGRMIRLRGALQAKLVQRCVVTLEPVPEEVQDSFEMIYAPQSEIATDPSDLALNLDMDDPPEPISDGHIDLGEAVAEHLALAMDPFPRKAGAEFVAHKEFDEGEPEPETRPNPFAKLASLKRNAE